MAGLPTYMDWGGQLVNLSIYSQQIKKRLSDVNQQRLSDSVYVSIVSDLTLAEYVSARQQHLLLLEMLTECSGAARPSSSDVMITAMVCCLDLGD